MIQKSTILEPQRFMHVNRFLKLSMQESILHIQLMNIPFLQKQQARYHAYGDRFDNQAKKVSP